MASTIILQREQEKEYIVSSLGSQGPPGIPGRQGTQGAPGASAGTPAATFIAGIDIGGHRVVYVGDTGVLYCDPTDSNTTGRAMGVTLNACYAGEQVTVQLFGQMTEPSWNWDTSKPVYIGLNGVLTQNPPTGSYVQVVAKPITTTSMYLFIREPIITV